MLSIILKILAVILVCVFIFLAIFDFFNTEYTLTSEIILLFCIALIIVCADAFDSFQIGSLINVKREKNLIEKENIALKEQNNTLINIASALQNNIQINNYTSEVKPANQREAAEKEKEEKIDRKMESSVAKRKTDALFRDEMEILNEYIKRNSFENATIIRDAKIETPSNLQYKKMLFDAYIKTASEELFIEIKHRVVHLSSIERQLSSVNYYNISNNANAKFVLILKQLTDEKVEQKLLGLDKLKEIFKSEIERGLMIIDVI